MTFVEYCLKKKIDPTAFKQKETVHWSAMETIFEQVSENSFTQQKKFLINDWRKKYPLKQAEFQTSEVKEIKPVKPGIKLPFKPKI